MKTNNQQLITDIAAYHPVNAQEKADQALMVRILKTKDNLFTRDAVAHFTASAWVVNPAHTKVLMVNHKIYHSWSWLGGHADGDVDLQAVALREVQEESGLTHIKLAQEGIYSLEVLTVDGHEKRGAYLSSHLHLNLTYLVEAQEDEPLVVKADENTGVAWFTLDEALAASSEPWFVKRIYRKLNEKLRDQ